jgi:valyl-tRNA synthetase
MLTMNLLVGEETGPVPGNLPSISTETKVAVAKAAQSSPIGSHVPGQDAGSKVGSNVAVDEEEELKNGKE